MVGTLIALARLFRSLGRAIADPATRGLVALTAVILATGTLFYRSAENWSVPDALYFSVVTLTTIGFGDLAPTTDQAKVFTIVYSLVGVGVVASFVASLAIFTRMSGRRVPVSGSRVVAPRPRGTLTLQRDIAP